MKLLQATGELDGAEFKRLIRVDLKVPPKDLSDGDIDKLVKALDDDGGGTLSLEELSDFVVRGSATFFAAQHDFKLAGLEKTIAYPIEPRIYLGDLRLLLGLFMLAITALLDARLARKETRAEST